MGESERRDRREGPKRKDQEPGVEDQERAKSTERVCSLNDRVIKRSRVEGREAEFLWDLTADAPCVLTHSPYLFTLLQLAWLWLPDCYLPSV